MRIYEIALFLLILNLAFGMTSTLMGTFYPSVATSYGETMNTSEVASEWAGTTRTGAEKVSETQTSIEAVFSFFNTVYKGLVVIIPTTVNFLWSAVTGIITFGDQFLCVNVELIDGQCALKTLILWPLQIITWIVYGVGIVQWYTGRGFREYQ